MTAITKWKAILIICICLICFFPYIFTRHGLIDFSETGQMGDTIGGIMGPFVAIVAAFLTFVAFWVQYEANLNQRRDIAIERIESKYYKMLDIYSQMTSNLEIHGIKGKRAFAELVGELTYVFYCTVRIYESLITDRLYLNNLSAQVKDFITSLEGDRYKKYEYLTLLSYNLFFYGKQYEDEQTKLSEDIKLNLFKINGLGVDATFIDYVKDDKHILNAKRMVYEPQILEGHSDFLGHYFRHLYQIVKFIANVDDTLVPEEKKYDYLKVLRAQMSDYEQILLYYNSLTKQGEAWNKCDSDSNPTQKGYIVRFRLIKNWPINFPCFGVDPIYKYKSEIESGKERGEELFENETLLLSRLSLTNLN